MHTDRSPNPFEALHCFDIGGSTIKSGTVDAAGEVRAGARVATPLHDFEAFAAAVETLIEGGSTPVALAVPGPVDPDTGRIRCANVPCIDGRPLAADLGTVLGRPVVVANDADCFALAEALRGAGRGHRIVFGIILGTGVGGGIVIDGRPLAGTGGVAGEWGHGPITATRAGSPPAEVPRFRCGCGLTGCVNTVGGARGLERLHVHLHGAQVSSTAILADWATGAPAATRTVDVWADLVADPLALAVNLLGPAVAPVGGGLGTVPALVARLDAAVRARVMRRSGGAILVPAACREPGLVGAGLLALGASRG